MLTRTQTLSEGQTDRAGKEKPKDGGKLTMLAVEMLQIQSEFYVDFSFNFRITYSKELRFSQVLNEYLVPPSM